jgi:AraC family transcriptional regulator
MTVAPDAPTAHRASYIGRINRVLDHIDARLAEPLDLEVLASVANFSPWHFHRVFRAMTGETLAERVRRRRLEVAAGRLLASPAAPASSIALDVGFASPEVFTRAFRAHFGVTPSAWRRGAYRAWAAAHGAQLRKIHQAESNLHQAVAEAFRQDRSLWPTGHVNPTGGSKMDVEVKNLPETRVAYMRNVGPYGGVGIPRTWQRFVAWCDERGLTQPRRTMYGICQDDPDVTPPQKCRYDACIEVDAAFKPEGEVGVQTVAGGRYACAKFAGTSAEVHKAWGRFVGEWMPDSGYQADDRPAIELYDKDFVMDEKTGAFSCRLCMPVRRL